MKISLIDKFRFWRSQRESARIFRQLALQSPVLANAQRLLKDADLLYQNHRYASATALTIIALEEVGKYLLDVWEQQPPNEWDKMPTKFTYDKNKYHISKQAAVVALFTAGAIRAKHIKKQVNFKNLNEQEVDKLIDAVKEAQEQEKINAAMVFAKVFEGLKHAGLYYDSKRAANGIEPKIITEGAAQNMLNYLARAIVNLTDPKCVYIGRSCFASVCAVIETEDKKQTSSKLYESKSSD